MFSFGVKTTKISLGTASTPQINFTPSAAFILINICFSDVCRGEAVNQFKVV